MNPETQVPRVRVSDVGRHEGETVEIAGWLYNLRRGGKICFPQVRDGSGVIQCVAVKSNLPEATFEALKDLTQESSLIVRGKLRDVLICHCLDCRKHHGAPFHASAIFPCR